MSNPKVKSQQQFIVGPDTDAIHFLDVKGNIIGWIDNNGTLQGNLITTTGGNTTNLQGMPLSPIPPVLNQVLSWNGSTWVPVTITVSISGGSNINFSDNETPLPEPDGNNTIFTLLHSPNPPSSLQLFINGLMQSILLVGNTITLSIAPQIGDVLEAFYRY
jgi:hypothetical protein